MNLQLGLRVIVLLALVGAASAALLHAGVSGLEGSYAAALYAWPAAQH